MIWHLTFLDTIIFPIRHQYLGYIKYRYLPLGDIIQGEMLIKIQLEAPFSNICVHAQHPHNTEELL